MSSGVVNVIAAEGERFVNLACVVCGDRTAADMVNVEVFQGDEFGEMVSFLANANTRRAARDFEITNDEVLAASEVKGVLSGVGSFENDLCSTHTVSLGR